MIARLRAYAVDAIACILAYIAATIIDRGTRP